MLLAIGIGPVILTSIVVFLVVIIFLIIMLLYARKKLTPQGEVDITINDDKSTDTTNPGAEIFFRMEDT